MSIKLPGGILRLIVNPKSAAPEAPHFVEAPLLVGNGTIGSTLTVGGTLATGEPTPELRYEWRRSGAVIPGAERDSYTVRPEDDLATLSARVTATNEEGTVAADTDGIVARYPAPTAAKALLDEILDHGGGILMVETAADFTGQNLRFAVTGPAGVTIDAETGLVAIDTDRDWTAGTITVSAQNSGGIATSSFQVTLEREAAPEEPDFTPASTEMRTSVEKDGVTFFFNEPAQVGRYCTGDWFVVMHPGLTLTATDPASRRVADETDTHAFAQGGRNLVGRYVHGLEIDPSDGSCQGFDSYTAEPANRDNGHTHRGIRSRKSIPNGGQVFQAFWAPALNMDPGFVLDTNAVLNPDHATDQPRGPLPLERPMSLVKAVSRAAPHSQARGGQAMLVVLTVVDKVPAEGAFRPPMGGPAVDLPVTWTEAAVQPFLETLPRLSFANNPVPELGTPATNPELWERMGRDVRHAWQTWNGRSTRARNITPLYQTNGGFNAYRREISDYLKLLMHALIADVDWQHKKDIFIGLIQIGIDQAARAHFVAKRTAISAVNNESWDVGRAAPTVLAATALPDSGWMHESLQQPDVRFTHFEYMPGGAWEDIRSYNTVTAHQRFDPPLPLPTATAPNPGVWDWIDPTPDLAPAGPVPGMLGHGVTNGRGTRPEGSSYLPGSQGVGYREINLRAMRDPLMPLWLIPGCFETFGDNGALRFIDRNYITVPIPEPELSVEGRFWREIRDNPLLEPFVEKTPNRLWTSPSVEGFGTALLVTVPPHDGDNGSPITGCDLRYRPLALTFNDDGRVIGEDTLGPWVEVEGITPNEDGQYIVSPEPAGGLLENTWYCVQVRYNNAIGKGPWSRTHRHSFKDDEWRAGGLMFAGQARGRTGVQMSTEAPKFATPPTMRSYFAEGTQARIEIVLPPREGASFTGFPLPSVTYQWRLDGAPIAGATRREITVPAGAEGKQLSCRITLTNSEGSDSIVVEGRKVGPAVADTGYAPAPMTTAGNVRFSNAGGVQLYPTANTKRITMAFIFGGRTGASARLIDSNRTQLTIFTGGRVAIQVHGGLSGTQGYMEFPGPNPEEPHWYLLSIDTTRPEENDRIRLYVRPAFGSYPPERIMPTVVRNSSTGSGSFQFDSNLRFATTASHALFPSDPDEQSFIIGDLFLERDAARTPEEFVAGNGQYIDPATIGAPFLLMGAGMSVDDWNEGRNLGTAAPATNPLPSAGGGGAFDAID